MAFKLRLIIIKSYLFLSTLLFPNNSIANPIPTPRIDNGNCYGPIPFENSSVYLKSEKIEVTISNVACVEASYTFKNVNSNNVNLSILLPFKKKPIYLKIYHDVSEISYSNIKYDIDFINKSWGNLDSIVKFPLSFSGYEIITINATYYRSYIVDESQKICSFSYIVGTTKYWNHSIDSAIFIFHVPEDIFYDGGDGFNICESNGVIVATMDYENWIPDENYISFIWEKEKRIDEKNDLPNVIYYVVPIMIFPTIIFIYFRRRKYNHK